MEECADYLRKNMHMTARMCKNKEYRKLMFQFPSVGDNVRIGTLIRIAQEINLKQLKGSIAEVGVYRGGFANRIRIAFPGRKFYLFDTFEGFPEEQVKTAQSRDGVTNFHTFEGTSVEIALKTIGETKDCIVKKGIFPETTKGIDDTFVFVSLDADLYEPTISGLEFFYPKMARGGYIMIHDFREGQYPGVGKAVDEFCDKYNIGYVPVADAIMSGIIVKN